jgi:hypothetical protein
MGSPTRGRKIAISPARRMVHELLHHSKKVPSLPLSKSLSLQELVEARQLSDPRPSWFAIFMKAYGLTAIKNPVLRRCYVPYLFEHYYEHPHSECSVLVEREWEGETVVLGAKVRAPENQTFASIDEAIKRFKSDPVLEVSSFRQVLRLGRLPGFVRRFTFWQSLYLSGYSKSKRFGTFMMSSLGNLGVEQHHPLTPLSTYFTFGPISNTGEVVIKIIYDHRIMDGGTVARCLNDLESILKSHVLDEIKELQGQ